MNYLIIESHPYEGSFNAGVAAVIQQSLDRTGHAVNRVNLVADGFDPVMRASDLKLWSQGKAADALVKRYMADVERADVLVFPFPVWWGTMPAVLKGFCDKVMLPGWAYKYGSGGELIGLLGNKHAVVISTMETPADIFANHYGNPVVGGFIKDTLQTCGISVLKHFEIDRLVSGGREYAEKKMSEIAGFFM